MANACQAPDEPRKSSRIVSRVSSEAAERAEPSAEDVAAMGRRVIDRLLAARDPRDGDALCEPFLRLPSRKQYPEYYVVIRRPISLSEVRTRLKQHEYASLADLRQDLELMCTNAKRFNERDSAIWLRARDLHGLAKEAVADALDEWRAGAVSARDAPRRVSVDARRSEADARQARSEMDTSPRGIKRGTSADEPTPPRRHKITLRPPRRDVKTEPPSSEPAETRSAKVEEDADAPATPRTPLRRGNTPAEPSSRGTAASAEAATPPAQPAAARSPQAAAVAPVRPQQPLVPVGPAPTTMVHEPRMSAEARELALEPRRRGAPRGKRLKAMLRWAVSSLVAHADPQGRAYSELFMELPSREEYPDYYQFIRHPVCFGDIERRLDSKSYINPHALVVDLRLMLDNAQFYNEEGSLVWNDAQALRRHLDMVLIPALLAEGFTLDPNDHRQAALPPGTPGGVPPPGIASPPGNAASSPIAPVPAAAAAATSPPPAAPPRPPLPAQPATGVQRPPPQPQPVVRMAPSAPPSAAPPAKPPAPQPVSLDRVLHDLEARVWPAHPTSFAPPPAAAAAPTPRDSPWSLIDVCWGDAAEVRIHVERTPAHTLTLPPSAVPASLRLHPQAAAPRPAVRVLFNAHELAGTWTDAAYEVLLPAAPGVHCVEALWQADERDGRVSLWCKW